MSKILNLLIINLSFSFSIFSQSNIIPEPLYYKAENGTFGIDKNTLIEYQSNDTIAFKMASSFSQSLNTHLAKPHHVQESINQTSHSIFFHTDKSNLIQKEGYELNVKSHGIEILAASEIGFNYAIVTLLNLVSPEIFHSHTKHSSWRIPCLTIKDAPRFPYRGLHLDVARHFMPISFLKKIILQLESRKMNMFHLHLTDDQGWRIEIKKYPLLTKIGSSRKETLEGHNYSYPHIFDNTPHSGFYTQDELKELVHFAALHYVTIIPEIEMPGHASAAIASYPYLGVFPSNPIEVPCDWGIFPHLFSYKDSTFNFLQDVLTEVMEIFPSKYIHIGGDEAVKIQWDTTKSVQKIIKKMGLKNSNELQAKFINRIEKFVKSKGREIIGWDEIMEGNPTSTSTIMSWRGEEGGIAAAKAKRNTIMCPSNELYFDYYQGNPSTEPLAVGGHLPLKQVYNYNPIPQNLPIEDKKWIIGAQANLWTEYMPTPSDVEYMLFPRIDALSEVVWGDEKNKNYPHFLEKMNKQIIKYHLDSINFSRVHFVPELELNFNKVKNVYEAQLKSDFSAAKIIYSLNHKKQEHFIKPIPIYQTSTLKAYLTGHEHKKSDTLLQTIHIHKGISKKSSFKYPYEKNRFKTHDNILTDGIIGSEKDMFTERWLRFVGVPMEVVYDMDSSTLLTSIKFSCINAPAYGFLSPNKVELFGSEDNKNFKSIEACFIREDKPWHKGAFLWEINIINPTKNRYYKLIAHTIVHTINSKGMHVPAQMLIDEIIMH